MKRSHLYLKEFFSYHYKKNMIIRLLFLSYPVPYKSSYSANGISMDLKRKFIASSVSISVRREFNTSPFFLLKSFLQIIIKYFYVLQQNYQNRCKINTLNFMICKRKSMQIYISSVTVKQGDIILRSRPIKFNELCVFLKFNQQTIVHNSIGIYVIVKIKERLCVPQQQLLLDFMNNNLKWCFSSSKVDVLLE